MEGTSVTTDRAPRPQRASAPESAPAEAVKVPNMVAQIVEEQAADNELQGLGKTQPPQPAPGASTPGYHIEKIIIDHDWGVNGPGTFTTLSGVVLNIRSYSSEMSQRIQRNMLPSRPKPPRTYHDLDDKWTTDENDPAYREALVGYIAQAGDVGFFSRTSLGTTLRSLPEDGSVFPLESDEWVKLISDPELYGEFGIKVREGGMGRYVDWLQFYVLAEGDIRELYDALDHASGIIREKVVQDAIKSFRSDD